MMIAVYPLGMLVLILASTTKVMLVAFRDIVVQGQMCLMIN